MKKIKILLLMLVACIFGLFGFNPSINAADDSYDDYLAYYQFVGITEAEPRVLISYPASFVEHGDYSYLHLVFNQDLDTEYVIKFNYAKEIYDAHFVNLDYVKSYFENPYIEEIFNNCLDCYFIDENELFFDFSLIYENTSKIYLEDFSFTVFLETSFDGGIGLSLGLDNAYYQYDHYFVNYCYVDVDGNTILFDKQLYKSEGTQYFVNGVFYDPNYEELGYYTHVSEGVTKEFVHQETEVEGSLAVYARVSWNYANLNVYSDSKLIKEEIQIERATTNLCEVLPWNISRQGYILQGFKLGDTLITANASECYFEDCLDLEINKFTNDFIVEAVWAKDKSLILSENNSVVQIKIPSDAAFDSFLNLSIDEIDLLDIELNLEDWTVYIDSLNNVPGNFDLNVVMYSYYDKLYNSLYIDFSKLIELLNSEFGVSGEYHLYPYFLDTVSDTDYITNYRFNLSNYQNLKTYYINDYDVVNNKVTYNEVVNTSLSPIIHFDNNTGLVLTRMYYINNGRKIELEDGDTLNGTYDIYIDLSYFVKFVNNNNTLDTETYVLKNALLTEPVSPTKTGYKFVGWYSDKDLTLKFDFSKNIMSDTTLYAKYEIINSSIIFNALGGTNVETITQGVYTQVSEPISPTKWGYEFDGWFLDLNYKQPYSFTTMPVNDITLYAKWTPCTATLIYNSNDGNDYVFAQEFEYGKSEKVLANIFTREGYKFIGWNTKADGSGISYSVGELINMSVSTLNVIDSDTPNELFAMWEEGIEATPSIPNDTTPSNPSFNLEGTLTWGALLMAIGVLAIVVFVVKRK